MNFILKHNMDLLLIIERRKSLNVSIVGKVIQINFLVDLLKHVINVKVEREKKGKWKT